MAGVKETQDLLRVAEVILVEIGEAVTVDGFQYEDLLVFLQSEAFAESLEASIKDIHLVPVELASLGWLGRARLVQDVWAVVQKVLKAFGR